jgi:hypothetical protein
MRDFRFAFFERLTTHCVLMRMGWVDMSFAKDGPFEIRYLLELLNSSQQQSDIYSQPIQPLVEVSANTGGMNAVGIENRFVAHISKAMSKTKSSLSGVSEVDP